MSTLEMLRKEGHEKGMGLTKLNTLLNIFKMAHQVPIANVAAIANLPISFVEKAKEYYHYKNESGLFELAKQEILSLIELNELEKAKITQTIGEALRQQS